MIVIINNLFNMKSLRIIIIVIYTCYWFPGYSYSFTESLDYYGFTEEKQKQAFQDLLQKANIIPADKTLEQVFPPKETKEELVSDIVKILQQIHQKFIARSNTQERWQAKPLEWINYNKKQILADLKILGFIDFIGPEQKNIDTFCILGSDALEISNRIEYVNSLIKNKTSTKAIILLAGERYVTKDIDGTEVELKKIANKFNIADWKKLTETHLIQNEYSKSTLSNNKNIKIHIIDTPKGDLPRPTTQTTIIKLIEWLKDHKEIQNIIFVSNQPYVKYQEAMIHTVFKEKNVDIKYEVVGNTAQDLDELQSLVEGLGTYLWAKTPLVLAHMNIQIISEENKQLLKNLYSENPLTYRVIPRNLIK